MDPSARRLERLTRHVIGSSAAAGAGGAGAGSGSGAPSAPATGDGSVHRTACAVEEPERDERGPVRWDGWGFDDTMFRVTEDLQVEVTGERYGANFPTGRRLLPKFMEFATEVLGIDPDNPDFGRTSPPPVPTPTLHKRFLEDIKGHYADLCTDGPTRLHHGHGHTCQDVYNLRFGSFDRLPDAVVFPSCHEDVEHIMKAAVKHNICIIPFGGGTSVCDGVACPADERRMILTVSTKRMNRVKWLDRENMVACVEAGAIGTDLDAELKERGVVLGHEPDSCEFSTLGGWIATRASGMKKNVYGNIEDILVNCKIVTPIGTLTRGIVAPRVSNGPDLMQLVLGSEGTLGIITEAMIRVRPMPEVIEYGSIVFPSFEAGVALMRDVAKWRAAPASIRLVDNTQFEFGRSLKPESATPVRDDLFDSAAKFFLINIKGFRPEEMVAATLVFQGTKAEVNKQRKEVFSLAKRHGGMSGGAANGRRGYFLTYMIAYLRDFGMKYHVMAESFETSVPWHLVLTLCAQVKQAIMDICVDNGVSREPWVSCRVTQTYDTGACIYFYFAFSNLGLKEPLHVFEKVETGARDAVLASGGSLSHHHGIGKQRKKWMKSAVTATGLTILRGLKKVVDPTNVMGSQNII